MNFDDDDIDEEEIDEEEEDEIQYTQLDISSSDEGEEQDLFYSRISSPTHLFESDQQLGVLESSHISTTDNMGTKADAFNRTSGKYQFKSSKSAEFITFQQASLASGKEKAIIALGLFENDYSDLKKNNRRETTSFINSITTVSNLIKRNKIADIDFKSPLGLVLGFYAVNDSNDGIDITKFNKILKILSSAKNIRNEDVIRYARYWIAKNNNVFR
ncbi:MAG: hypothetical protein JKX76_01915 [Colwellia sp.]|nr:hypothetical protein [Colwellia sp.]